MFSLRRRLHLPEREIGLQDQFLIARSRNRPVVLLIDSAQEVLGLPPAAVVDAASIASGPGYIRGVISLPDGLVLIHDLDLFLSTEEVHAMDEALSQGYPHAG